MARAELPDGLPVWLVTRHEDILTVLAGRRFGRAAAATLPGSGFGRSTARNLTNMDAPEHDRLRRLLAPAFTPPRVRGLAPLIEHTADELLDAMMRRGRAADIVGDFASPLSGRMICAVLGLPWPQWSPFTEQTGALLAATANTAARPVRQELTVFAAEQIRARHGQPSDDLVTHLLNAHDREGLAWEEVIDSILGLFIAGHEGTLHLIARTMLTLLSDASRFRALREDPSLLDGATEEAIRYHPSSNEGVLRVALVDVELGGVTISAGDAVLAPIVAATWDPAYISQPGYFDMRRAEGRSLGFGHGPHFCLGAALVRAELRIALDRLAKRLPGLRLAAPSETVRIEDDALILRVPELPVLW